MDNNLITVITRPTQVPCKAELLEILEAYAKRFAEGTEHTQPLLELLMLKRIEYFTKEALKVIMPWAAQEAKNYSDKERACLYNSKVAIKPAKKTYDFSQNKDWCLKKAEIEGYKKMAEEAAKEYIDQQTMAENELKALEDNLVIAKTVPVIDEGEDSIAITIL